MKKEKLIEIIKKRYNLTDKEASGLILAGKVLMDEIPVTKTGVLVDPDKIIRIKKRSKYVSRGAYKLLNAFKYFDISVENKICIDVGSSTGGFTQVLLEKGAQKVYAIDCGTNQIDYSLRYNSKVVVMENTKFTDINKSSFNESIDFAVMDVSFTSSVNLIRHLYNNLNIKNMVVLIKPQFEYQRLKDILKLRGQFNGIVKNESDLKKIIEYIKSEIETSGLNIINIVPSNIKGTKGNLEYLFHIER